VWNSQVLRAGATVLPTDHGRDLLLPKTASHPAAGTIVSEGAAIGENDPVFGAGTLHRYKWASLIQVTNELLQDTEIDLLGYLAAIIGRQLGNGMGAHFTTGTGSSQPTGFVKTGGTVVTGGTGQSGIATASELIDVYYNLSEPYRENAKWFLSNTAAKGIRKLTASTSGLFQWTNGLDAAPDSLFGMPVFTDPNMPAAAVNGTSVAFGDFSAYHVRLTPLSFERSDDFAYGNDIVTFRAKVRADGLNLDSGAFSFYVGGTS
jgi:HK97 family phage major capsid protein